MSRRKFTKISYTSALNLKKKKKDGAHFPYNRKPGSLVEQLCRQSLRRGRRGDTQHTRLEANHRASGEVDPTRAAAMGEWSRSVSLACQPALPGVSGWPLSYCRLDPSWTATMYPQLTTHHLTPVRWEWTLVRWNTISCNKTRLFLFLFSLYIYTAFLQSRSFSLSP